MRAVPALLLAACFGAASALADEGPLERAGKAVDDAAEKTGHALEHAAEKTAEVVKETATRTGEGINKGVTKAGDAIKSGARKVTGDGKSSPSTPPPIRDESSGQK